MKINNEFVGRTDNEIYYKIKNLNFENDQTMLFGTIVMMKEKTDFWFDFRNFEKTIYDYNSFAINRKDEIEDSIKDFYENHIYTTKSIEKDNDENIHMNIVIKIGTDNSIKNPANDYTDKISKIIEINKKIIGATEKGTEYIVKNLKFNRKKQMLFGSISINKETKKFYVDFKRDKTEWDLVEDENNTLDELDDALYDFISNHITEINHSKINKDKNINMEMIIKIS